MCVFLFPLAHTHQGDQMVPFVRPEDGEGLAVEVGMPQPAGLDDGPDVRGFGLELALQDPGGAVLSHFRESFGCQAIIRPYPVNVNKLQYVPYGGWWVI